MHPFETTNQKNILSMLSKKKNNTEGYAFGGQSCVVFYYLIYAYHSSHLTRLERNDREIMYHT